MIHPGSPVDLQCIVVTSANAVVKTTGTVYVYARRSSDGYWLKADLTWAVGVPTGIDVPLASGGDQGFWYLTLSGGVTALLQHGDRILARMTDNETPASSLTASDADVHDVDALAANLDVAVSSRSTFAGGAVASVTGSVGSVVGLDPSLLDVAVSSRSTLGGVEQTGDSFARLGAPTGASIAADIAAAVSAGAGTELLTVTVLGPGAVPVLGAIAYAHSSTGTLLGTVTTDASGVGILAPGPGEITLTVRYAGMTFTATTATVSVGVNQTATLTGVALPNQPPRAPMGGGATGT